MSKFFFLLAWLGVVSFLSLEVSLRIYDHTQRLNDPPNMYLKAEDGWGTLKPNYEAMVRNSEAKRRIKININANGFRAERDYKQEKEAGVTRIAVLGDSITFGVGVDHTDTFCAKTEEQLDG